MKEKMFMNTQKFEVLDYTALVKLSFRSKYWRVDHKARTDQWSKETQWLFWGIIYILRIGYVLYR
mgnify:CR=1 FL=1